MRCEMSMSTLDRVVRGGGGGGSGGRAHTRDLGRGLGLGRRGVVVVVRVVSLVALEKVLPAGVERDVQNEVRRVRVQWWPDVELLEVVHHMGRLQTPLMLALMRRVSCGVCGREMRAFPK